MDLRRTKTKTRYLELLFEYQNVPKYEFRTLSNELLNNLEDDCDYSFLHPGISAMIYINNKCSGYIGALHPKIQKELGLDKPLLCFELDVDSILSKRKCTYKDISKFPAIHRDLAFLVDKNLESQKILDKVRKTARKVLTDSYIFDVYQGPGIEPDKKSVALTMVFQHQDKTLVDEDINSLMDKIIATIIKECDAVLRD